MRIPGGLVNPDTFYYSGGKKMVVCSPRSKSGVIPPLPLLRSAAWAHGVMHFV